MSANPEQTIAVIGLGYVGLPLAVALAQYDRVIGFDIDDQRIAQLQTGMDASGEVGRDELQHAGIWFTAEQASLRTASIFIIAVPTPVDGQKFPDLGPLEAATEIAAMALKPGDLVIYESTVYPGATEEVCVPILERISGLRLDRDFSVGYSPERISPGDKNRQLQDIVKVTSGSNPEAALRVDALYRRIVRAGTHMAPCIRVAEAAKAVENTQRDINIAFANELALMFSKMDIDVDAVLAAAGTKWNFMPVRPGLVGGHCIGVDPYYLIHKAKAVGAEARLVQAAREINEGMGLQAAQRLQALMEARGIAIKGARVLILGLTFKEDCADLRNSRVADIVALLSDLGAQLDIHDPRASADTARAMYGIVPITTPAAHAYDAILLAVAHTEYRQIDAATLAGWRKQISVVLDLKSVLRHLPDVSRL